VVKAHDGDHQTNDKKEKEASIGKGKKRKREREVGAGAPTICQDNYQGEWVRKGGTLLEHRGNYLVQGVGREGIDKAARDRRVRKGNLGFSRQSH